ncbi:MAG: PorV/PorQ family protein [candidate division Zixibacteria bacterium]|nr:PorV/PorQ family protein [candidate division Zixibacteria bacterium]
MKRFVFLFGITVIGILAAVPVHALSGLRLMTVECGARPVGMGGAFTAVIRDPYSFGYNPAAVHGVVGLNGSLGHNTHWENVNIESGYLAFAKKDVTFGFGLKFGAVDDLQGRNDSIPSSDYIPFDAQDIAIKGGASYAFTEKLTLGFGLGYMFEKIESYRGSAFNFDLGLLFNARPDLTVGVAVLNIGSGIELRRESYDIPTTVRAGAAYTYDNLMASADVVMFDDDAEEGMDLRGHLGGEYALTPEFTVRAGYRLGYESKSISAGFGFSKRNFRIDYAFLPYSNELDDSHLINLTFSQ